MCIVPAPRPQADFSKKIETISGLIVSHSPTHLDASTSGSLLPTVVAQTQPNRSRFIMFTRSVSDPLEISGVSGPDRRDQAAFNRVMDPWLHRSCTDPLGSMQIPAGASRPDWHPVPGMIDQIRELGVRL